jgi:hypothetical protein
LLVAVSRYILGSAGGKIGAVYRRFSSQKR